MLITKTVTELLDAFASSEPTPGGGSAAALAGAMGASLLAMVAGLPKTKTNTPEERAALDAARAELTKSQKRLAELVDRDTDAYNLVVAAYKKPKVTDEEKAARQRAIQDGMRAATEVPAETMQAAAEALKSAHAVAANGITSAMSDVAVGTHLLMTAMSGAMLNVGVNIGSLKDAAVVDQIKMTVNEAMTSAGASAMNVFRSTGLADLTRDISTTFNLQHGKPPSGDQLTTSLTSLLLHIASPDARKALESLASSEDPKMRDAATTALGKMPPR